MEKGEQRGPALRRVAAALGCTPADAVALAVLAVGGCAALALLWWSTPGAGATFPLKSLAGAEVGDDPLSLAEAGDEVFVHVAGSVARPGVYRLRSGARVGDALAAAGGPLPAAGLDALNLARPLGDGDQIFVPDATAPSAAGVGGGGPAGPGAGPGTGSGAARPDGRMDLNRATAAELTSLPGIGPVLAERIVTYREEQGGFRSVNDLRGVSGIGEVRFQALVDLVAV